MKAIKLDFSKVKITNVSANGKVIPDLSEVELPDELNDFLVDAYLKDYQKREAEKHEQTTSR